MTNSFHLISLAGLALAVMTLSWAALRVRRGNRRRLVVPSLAVTLLLIDVSTHPVVDVIRLCLSAWVTATAINLQYPSGGQHA